MDHSVSFLSLANTTNTFLRQCVSNRREHPYADMEHVIRIILSIFYGERLGFVLSPFTYT